MKIGVLSDIHGNNYALEKVVDEALNLKVEKFFILGDSVGYYYHPDKVLNILSSVNCDVIKGNHEQLLGLIIKGSITIDSVTKKYGVGHAHAIEKMTREQIDFIINSPDQIQREFGKKLLLFCHGSPWDPSEYLYPDTTEKRLKRIQDYSHDLIFCGHSHFQFTFKSENNMLVNVGSVGQNRKNGGVANWASYNINTNLLKLHSTAYSTKALKREAKILDASNPYNYKVLVRGNRK